MINIIVYLKKMQISQPVINENNYNYVIKELQNYILNKDFLNNIVNKISNKEANSVRFFKKEIQSKDVTPTLVPNKSKEKDKFTNTNFKIQQKDVLFWIFYVMVFGEIEYEKIKPITLVQEKKIKIEFIEKCRLKKSILKSFKFTSLVHIENQLLNETMIDLNTFFSLCAIENKNVFYVNKNTYYELLFPLSESMELLLLTKLENPSPVKFKFQLLSNEDSKSDILDNYRRKFYKIESLHKPVKAISNYKLSELKDLCIKLGVDIINKESGIVKKKMELYEQIVQYF